jgi:hypothetical protein
MVTTISLVKQTVNRPMVLAGAAGSSLKVETHVKSGVPCGLNQDQLSESQRVLILPHLSAFKLFHLLEKVLG